MVWQIRAVPVGRGERPDPMTFGQLFRLAATHRPQVAIPKVESETSINLGQNMTQAVDLRWAEDPLTCPAVRAQVLISCVAVCFLNTDHTAGVNEIGYVLHAGAGAVSGPEFHAAMTAMHVVANHNIRVVYAHPNATEPGYQEMLRQLVGWGLADRQVLEVTDLVVPAFAMKPPGIIGY
jgi:hypothetical protein